MSFWCSPKGTHHDRCRTTMIKHYFAIAMKANGIGWCSSRKDEPSPGCHGLSRLVSRDIVSDVPRNDQFLFWYCFLKNELFKLTEGYPRRPVSRNYLKKNYFALTTNGNRWCSSKRWWFFPLRLIFYVCSFARNWSLTCIYEIPFGE